jgi:hypothetical protein
MSDSLLLQCYTVDSETRKEAQKGLTIFTFYFCFFMNKRRELKFLFVLYNFFFKSCITDLKMPNLGYCTKLRNIRFVSRTFCVWIKLNVCQSYWSFTCPAEQTDVFLRIPYNVMLKKWNFGIFSAVHGLCLSCNIKQGSPRIFIIRHILCKVHWHLWPKFTEYNGKV